MGIYDGIATDETLDLAARQRDSALAMTRLINENFTTLNHIYKSGFDILNHNPYGLTFEQVVSSLATEDWVKFYTEACMMKALINHVRPGTIVDQVGG